MSRRCAVLCRLSRKAVILAVTAGDPLDGPTLEWSAYRPRTYAAFTQMNAVTTWSAAWQHSYKLAPVGGSLIHEPLK
jgi:hypothetical protein